MSLKICIFVYCRIITRETGFSQTPRSGDVPHRKTYGTRAMLVADGERNKPRLHRLRFHQ